MLKTILFQSHWLLGITAGIVLSVVGVTGALLSFEDELLHAWNPDSYRVQPRDRGLLSPGELAVRLKAELPGRRLNALILPGDPHQSVQATFDGAGRGERHYVDPYSGELKPQPRGEAFFSLVEQLHRRLAAEAPGKQLVGASTLALLFLALTGLYLRWPHRFSDWRAWFQIKTRGDRRSFWWSLHAVSGTLALPLYLLAALTGLFWSYDWYRKGLVQLAGAEAPRRPPGAERRGAPTGAGPDWALVDRQWQAFRDSVSGFEDAILRFPGGEDAPLTIQYRSADAAHERARDEITIDAAGQVSRQSRYRDKSAGNQLIGAVFPLHKGSYFGVGGTVLMCLASLVMPLFAFSGWCLYLDRRRLARELRAAWQRLDASAQSEALTIYFASQTGRAERLALQTADALQRAGLRAQVASLAEFRLDHGRCGAALFIASSYGDGGPPDALRVFCRKTMARPARLNRLQYAVLALGDRQYSLFCGFGRRLDAWLRASGARPAFDAIEVDAGDEAAIRLWQLRLEQWTGRLLDLVAEAPFAPWRLTDRQLVNEGSPGAPVYRLRFEPMGMPLPDWRGGAVAEILPRHDVVRIASLARGWGLDPEADTADGGTLGQWLATRQLPADAPGTVALADCLRLPPLIPRSYSIASLPAAGAVELLLRRYDGPQGTGVASAWLTGGVAIGETVPLRLRDNPMFQVPGDARPAIFIGNGTGLAGLRALLAERIAAGRNRNWLLFGERSPLHDRPYEDELQAWLAAGQLVRLDRAYSRSEIPGNARYVQDLLREHAKLLAHWVGHGAMLYVCGSAKTMARDVDRCLAEVLGAGAMERMIASGRYRRDVY